MAATIVGLCVLGTLFLSAVIQVILVLVTSTACSSSLPGCSHHGLHLGQSDDPVSAQGLVHRAHLQKIKAALPQELEASGYQGASLSLDHQPWNFGFRVYVVDILCLPILLL